jgi:hypothetical protein
LVNFNTAITAPADAFKAGYHTQSPPQVKAAFQLSGSLPGTGYLKISIAMPYGKMLLLAAGCLVCQTQPLFIVQFEVRADLLGHGGAGKAGGYRVNQDADTLPAEHAFFQVAISSRLTGYLKKYQRKQQVFITFLFTLIYQYKFL